MGPYLELGAGFRAGKGLRSRIALSLNPLGGGRLDDDGPRDRYSYAHPAAAVGRLRQPIRNRRVAEPLPSRNLSGHDHAGRPRIPKRDEPMLRDRPATQYEYTWVGKGWVSTCRSRVVAVPF